MVENGKMLFIIILLKRCFESTNTFTKEVFMKFKGLISVVMAAVAALSMTMPALAADVTEIAPEQTGETVNIAGYDCWEEDGNYFSVVDGEVSLIINLTDMGRLSECAAADVCAASSNAASGRMYDVDLTDGKEYAGQIDISNGDCSTPVFYKSKGSVYSRFKFRTGYVFNTTYSMTVKLDWAEDDGFLWNNWLQKDDVTYTFNLAQQSYKSVIILYWNSWNTVCQIDFHKSGSSGQPIFNYWMSASN